MTENKYNWGKMKLGNPLQFQRETREKALTICSYCDKDLKQNYSFKFFLGFYSAFSKPSTPVWNKWRHYKTSNSFSHPALPKSYLVHYLNVYGSRTSKTCFLCHSSQTCLHGPNSYLQTKKPRKKLHKTKCYCKFHWC